MESFNRTIEAENSDLISHESAESLSHEEKLKISSREVSTMFKDAWTKSHDRISEQPFIQSPSDRVLN